MVSLTNTSAVLLDALAHLEAEGKTLETRLYDLRAFVLRITYMRRAAVYPQYDDDDDFHDNSQFALDVAKVLGGGACEEHAGPSTAGEPLAEAPVERPPAPPAGTSNYAQRFREAVLEESDNE
ncbi:hypothetical protein AAVH_08039 [Aphelenchoides avenae]|nr:hypothetical protein AAVH_08039 [Aphelenchus avenae]